MDASYFAIGYVSGSIGYLAKVTGNLYDAWCPLRPYEEWSIRQGYLPAYRQAGKALPSDHWEVRVLGHVR